MQGNIWTLVIFFSQTSSGYFIITHLSSVSHVHVGYEAHIELC